MATFTTSDIHFGHKNIIHHCNRPYRSVEEMDAALIDNWNAAVKPTDTIYSLGDFAFCKLGRLIEILKQLNGYKIFINGNHCQVVKKNKQQLLDAKLINEIYDSKEVTLHNRHFVLFHFPMISWHQQHRGSIHLHGHLHDAGANGYLNGLLPRKFGKIADVGVDSTYFYGEALYRPFDLLEVIDYMDKIELTPGHH